MSDFQSRLQRALDADYLIERELHGGGMSRVFVATERALDRKVVIKVLPPDLAAGVNVERFRREIQLAAQLQHPHIVPLLSAGDDDNLLWFTMPYIDGESLRQALDRQKRLNPRDVVRILHDVVDALAYAHARGIVHRDIKPDNILTSGMHAMVTDFGVAKALSASIPVHGNTTTGMAIGTPAYMAPEQLAADPAADHRVDLYAVGLLAYELLTGSSPFTGSSPQATLAAQLTLKPEPPHRSFSDIPEPLSLLIMHCLEKDASRRPQSASELRAEIEALPPMSGSAALAVRRATRATWLAVSLAVITIAAGLFAYSQRGIVDELEASKTTAGNQDSSTHNTDLTSGSSAGQGLAAAHDDSIPAFRELADGVPTTAVQLVITRAESLAIADAVRKRQAADATRQRKDTAATLAQTPTAGGIPVGPPTTGMQAPGSGGGTGAQIVVRTADGHTATLNRDALLEEVARIFADSMSRALKQMESTLARSPRLGPTDSFRVPQQGFTPLLPPPSDNRLRIVVAGYTPVSERPEIQTISPEIQTISSEMTRRLRASISDSRLDVVNAETTERALRRSPDRMALGWSLRADYVVGGRIGMRGDSVVVHTQLTDVRSGRFSRVFETAATMADVRSAFNPTRLQVTAWLDTAATRGRALSPRAGEGPVSPNADPSRQFRRERIEERGLPRRY